MAWKRRFPVSDIIPMTVDESRVTPMIVDDSNIIPMMIPEIRGPVPKFTRQGVRDLNKLGPRPTKIRPGKYSDQLCRRGIHDTVGRGFIEVPRHDPRSYAGILVKYCANCGKEADSFCPYDRDDDRY
jgi:hypothetical protein